MLENYNQQRMEKISYSYEDVSMVPLSSPQKVEKSQNLPYSIKSQDRTLEPAKNSYKAKTYFPKGFKDHPCCIENEQHFVNNLSFASNGSTISAS